MGTAYNATLQASGGAGTLTWSLASGSALPAGLSLSSAGAISGTPTAPGPRRFTVKVTDPRERRAGRSRRHNSSASRIKPAVLTVTTTSLSNGVVGTAYNATVAASGGTGTITWSVTTGTLPAGLSLSGSDDLRHAHGGGRPHFTVTATDSGTPPQTANQALSITINPKLVITTASLPNGVVSAAYNASLQSTAASGTITWSRHQRRFAGGLTMTGAGRDFRHTHHPGASSFKVTAKDSGTPQQSAQQALSITIYAGLSIITTTLPNGI